MEEMNLGDPTPVEVCVTIGSKRYVLCEPTGDADVKYRNALTRHAKLGPSGVAESIGEIADAEPILIANCLFEIQENDSGDIVKRTPVHVRTIRGWREPVQKALFDKLQKIGKPIQDGEEVKNLPDATEGGSD